MRPTINLKYVVVFLILLTSNANAEPTANVLNAQQRSIRQSIDFDKLIDSLASSNLPPKFKGGEPVFDSGYKFNEQVRIKKTIDVLLICMEDAWPVFHKYLDDKRYSYTVGYSKRIGDTINNLSVGEVCQQLIKNALEANDVFFSNLNYKNQVINLKELQVPEIQDESKLKNWIIERKNKTLCDLQLEVIDYGRQKTQAMNLGKEKQLVDELFVEIIGDLKKSKQPRLPQKFMPHIESWSYLSPDDDPARKGESSN
jgi:hypothetical protein